MKLKLLILLCTITGLIKVKAQWDNIPVKTKFYYSLSREKHKWYGGTLFKRKTLFTVILDTTIQLSNDRRLIVFSKCMNAVLLNESVSILKDSILQPDMMIKIVGDPLIGDITDNSDKQSTIIYQIKTAMYLLTVPRNFFTQKLRKNSIVKELNKCLLQSIVDSSLYGIYGLKPYIFFNGFTLPLNNFAIIKGGNEDTKRIAGKNDYLFNFLRFQGEVNIGNNLSAITDQYVDGYNRGMYKGSTIYFSKKYGIVKAESTAYDKQNECSFVNTFELQKVEFPK